MKYRVAVSELGIPNDGAVFEGETPGDVLERLVPHLKEKHDIELPDVADLLSGGAGALLPARAHSALPVDRGIIVPAAVPNSGEDAGVQLILTRLAEKLNLRDSGLAEDGDLNPAGSAG